MWLFSSLKIKSSNWKPPKDEDDDDDYEPNDGKKSKRIRKYRLDSKIMSQKDQSVTSKKISKKNLKMTKQGKISKNSGNSVSQDISGSIFDKSKDTRASEKMSVKKGTKKKAITNESLVGTIEEPKTVRGDKQQICFSQRLQWNCFLWTLLICFFKRHMWGKSSWQTLHWKSLGPSLVRVTCFFNLLFSTVPEMQCKFANFLAPLKRFESWVTSSPYLR